MGEFFGLSRRKFTDAELKLVSVAVAKALLHQEDLKDGSDHTK